MVGLARDVRGGARGVAVIVQLDRQLALVQPHRARLVPPPSHGARRVVEELHGARGVEVQVDPSGTITF